MCAYQHRDILVYVYLYAGAYACLGLSIFFLFRYFLTIAVYNVKLFSLINVANMYVLLVKALCHGLFIVTVNCCCSLLIKKKKR